MRQGSAYQSLFPPRVKPMSPRVNPALVYAQLTNVLTGVDPNGGIPEPGSTADLRVLQGESVLDLVRDDIPEGDATILDDKRHDVAARAFRRERPQPQQPAHSDRWQRGRCR
jgi:hypothetical protein